MSPPVARESGDSQPGAGPPPKDAPYGMKVALCMTFSVHSGDFQRTISLSPLLPMLHSPHAHHHHLKTTARRFVLGRQGLWPGRRWAGQEGTAQALRTIEEVQMCFCQ